MFYLKILAWTYLCKNKNCIGKILITKLIFIFSLHENRQHVHEGQTSHIIVYEKSFEKRQEKCYASDKHFGLVFYLFHATLAQYYQATFHQQVTRLILHVFLRCFDKIKHSWCSKTYISRVLPMTHYQAYRTESLKWLFQFKSTACVACTTKESR